MEDTTRISMRLLLKALVATGFSLLMGSALSAQTQVGIVKTRGRMVNGQLVRGKGIPDATVQLKDRSVLSQKASGAFSFPVTGQKYSVKSVQKAGYQLLDPQVCREYDLSRDTLYLVMEKPEQIRFDEMEKERRLRKELQTKLQEKEDEILAMNVTLEEKNHLLDQIDWQRQEIEKTISTLAKQYSAIDYDLLDDFQRKVNLLLEEGEIDKALSLLNSKGSMESRIQEIRRELAMEKEEEDELARREETLFKSKQVTQKKVEDAAADCYNYYRGFYENLQLDSALFYLELRASLDTLNVNWQYDAGACWSFYDDELAMLYFRRVLRHASPTDRALMDCYVSMALMNSGKDDTKALEYNTEALRIADVIGEDLDRMSLNSRVAQLYHKKGDYVKELEYLQNAIPIAKEIYGADHDILAVYDNRTGYVYREMKDYSKALDCFRKALDKRKNSISFEKAECYFNISLVYSDKGDYKKAVNNGLKAISLMEDFSSFDENKTYHGWVANIYARMENYPKAVEYFQKALTLYETYPHSDESEAEITYEAAGACYEKMKDYSKAVEYFKKALSLLEKEHGSEHPDIASLYSRIGYNYYQQGVFMEALHAYQNALTTFEAIFGTVHPDVADACDNLGTLYFNADMYGSAVIYYKYAVQIRERLYGPDDPRLATSYENLAEAYSLSDEQTLAEEYYKKAKALRK